MQEEDNYLWLMIISNNYNEELLYNLFNLYLLFISNIIYKNKCLSKFKFIIFLKKWF